jgi:gliding motility-associated-like protein
VIIYTEQAEADAGLDQLLCSNELTQLGGVANPNYDYSWSTSFGLSDTTIANPAFSLVNNSSSPIMQEYVLTTNIGGGVSSCPNTDTVLVTVYPNVDTNLVVTQCDQLFTFNGNIINTSGNYTANLTSQYGCDSIVNLDLTINNAVTGVDTQVSCGPYLWIDGNTYSSSTSVPTFTIAGGATNGCDSIVTLNLTVNNPVNSTDVETACESFTWIDGITYTASTNTPIYNYAGGAVNGCDSTVTLNLTINNNAYYTDVHTACDSYTWIDGVTYTASNTTAIDTIYGGAINGCDSITILDLTINNQVTYIDVHYACDSFTWTDGVTYYSSNSNAQQYYPGGAWSGCDSTVTLDLTIGSSQVGVDVQQACDSLTWIDGITYSSSTNSPTFVLAGAGLNGCDSTVSLNLTVSAAPLVTVSTDTTICAGGLATLYASGANTYIWSPLINNQDDMQIAEVSPGTTTTYFVTGYNSAGCSSTVSTTVFVEDIPDASFTVSPSELDLLLNTTINFSNTSSGAVYYEWNMGDSTSLLYSENVEHTFSNETSGSYVVTLYAENSVGCSDSYTYTVNIAEGLLVYIPNTFTPNGDGFNQTFKPFISGGFDAYMYSFEIYNRWGELIFVSLNPEIGWDGSYNGVTCLDGTYTYRLNYKMKNDDRKDFILGHVNLIR